MAYSVQTWADNDPRYPVSAARMQHIESGIDAVANGGSLTYVGAPTGGDDTTLIQNAINAAPGEVWLQAGATYLLTGTTGLTIDPTVNRLRGAATKIDCSGMTGGTALTIKSNNQGLNSAGKGGFEGIELYGPGKTSGVTGVATLGASGTNQNAILFSCLRSTVHNFQIGISEGNYAWAIDFWGLTVYDCANLIDNAACTVTGGERMTFVGCSFFNATGIALNLASGFGDHEFIGCSFDDTIAQLCALVGPGSCYLYGCHVEFTATATVPVALSGTNARFVMAGGTYIQKGAAAASVIVSSSGSGHIAAFDKVAMSGVATTGGGFATGGSQSTYCFVSQGYTDGTVTAVLPAAFPGRTAFQGPVYQQTTAPTISAGGTTTLDTSITAVVEYTVTTGSAITISLSNSPPTSRTQDLMITILNSSGGTLGTITWPASFSFGSLSWTNPASTKRRSLKATYNPSQGKYVVTFVSGADY